MRAVRNMLEERSSHANIMERQDHRKALRFISTIELPFRFNKLLNTTVDEEHKRRKKDEDRITQYYQIYQSNNLPRPELEMKITDAGYSSLYNYESFSAQDCAWNIVHTNSKVCKIF